MKGFLITQFIDDELDLREKKLFVENVHNEDDFYEEAVSSIDFEIMMKNEIEDVEAPTLNFPRTKKTISYKKITRFAQVLAASIIIIFAFNIFNNQPNKPVVQKTEKLSNYRFVIYKPDAKKVEISGEFTNWKPLKLKEINQTGYWEAEMKLKPGEYKYFYLINDKKVVADPTSPYKEEDGFGNKNSILRVNT